MIIHIAVGFVIFVVGLLLGGILAIWMVDKAVKEEMRRMK